MNLSASTRYAIRLLFELREAEEPVPIATLAEKTGIAFKTIEKIHTELKKNGFTDAIVGPKGGIVLLVPLTNISLGEMITLFDHGIYFSICQGDKANECPSQQNCSFSPAWQQVSKKIQKQLDAISLWNMFHGYYEDSSLSFSILPLKKTL